MTFLGNVDFVEGRAASKTTTLVLQKCLGGKGDGRRASLKAEAEGPQERRSSGNKGQDTCPGRLPEVIAGPVDGIAECLRPS